MADPESPEDKKTRGPQNAIVSRNAVQDVVKEVERRPTIEAKAVDRMIEYIDQFSRRLANDASDRALQADRRRIEVEDVDGAYASIAGETSTPGTVFESIDKLDTEELRDLVLTITNWLKERQGRRT